MPMDVRDIENLIREALPGAHVDIKDLAGDGDHYAAHVIAEQFRGKTKIQQHRLVYASFKGEMGRALHALALTTSVPDAKES